MHEPEYASKCKYAIGTWAPGACTARGTRGAAGRARARVQQAEAQRHPNGLTRVLHTCHAKWRESGVNVPLSTARKRHEHAARARQGVRHKRSLCTLQKLIGLDRPVLAAPQLEPWRACNLLRSRGDLSLLAEAKLLRRASICRHCSICRVATESNEALRDGRSMSGILFYTHLILFNQVSTLTGAAKRYVSVVGTGKILIRTLCPDSGSTG